MRKNAHDFPLFRYDPHKPDRLLADKINERHIDKILALSDQSEARSFRSSSQLRWFTLAYVVIAVLLFAFLTVFLVRANTDLYREIVKLLAVFLGGFGGGFGIKSYMERRGGV
uniref:Uncharacterized protein n=1 Tax=Candidatus Kentrum sp. DK TaxID=2126562 RepID=A0A450T8V5_9GAMM|nr:MAG: hypothetical protein BECKDK2373C_GA0170839_105024 [Candidatus Kentron sp. DK]VFJ63125.1 MAG: hypothetical protein BECKDK2373B_GA0170837_11201 [Candidatus Kentron sp. DK]